MNKFTFLTDGDLYSSFAWFWSRSCSGFPRRTSRRGVPFRFRGRGRHYVPFRGRLRDPGVNQCSGQCIAEIDQ